MYTGIHGKKDVKYRWFVVRKITIQEECQRNYKVKISYVTLVVMQLSPKQAFELQSLVENPDIRLAVPSVPQEYFSNPGSLGNIRLSIG